MDSYILILGTFFFVVNLTAFLIMLLDKRRAKEKGTERISEGVMFFLAAVLGSFGVYAGMFYFRHKTHKWYFIFGIPLLMLQNFSLLYLLHLNLTKYF